MELPLNTIVITILVLFVLVGVGIFFFSQAQASDNMMDDAQCVQMCYTAAANAAAGTNINDAKRVFCEHSCDKVVDCSITAEQKIEC